MQWLSYIFIYLDYDRWVDQTRWTVCYFLVHISYYTILFITEIAKHCFIIINVLTSSSSAVFSVVINNSVWSITKCSYIYNYIYIYITSTFYSLNTDILFGRQFGLKTLLVLTGVTKETDLQNVPSERVPDFYTNSISDLLKVMNWTCLSMSDATE